MIKNYLKIAWRNLLRNKVSSFINITGLAIGMAVAILIGLWIYDELSYNKNFKNYDRIAQVMQNQTFNDVTNSQTSLPYLMGDELKNSYGSDFKNISMSSWMGDHILAFGEKKITQTGSYMEPSITDMLSLKMLNGTRSALRDKHSIIISASAAKAIFGNADPMDKTIKIDSKFEVKVTGVYEDLAYNSDFGNLSFVAVWQLYIDDNYWLEKATNPWRNNSFQTFVQLADNADMNKVSTRIKDVKLKKVTPQDAAFKPLVFLHPMSKWHLYSEFKNGINTGGKIEYVWLCGIIGVFVLLLACINFMNLSTARSEKRAKEVGIRKSIGSMRPQLIIQFFSESLMVVAFAFLLSLLLVQLGLPFFNDVSDKKMAVPLLNLFFWLIGLAFSLVTGLIAGSYPAFYLSSFNPVAVLKGTFKAGRFSAVPRKVLVTLQFTVSIMLIIGTIVVFRQIQFAKSRPVGYSREGLLSVYVVTEEVHKHFAAIQDDLKKAGAIAEISESSSATTYVNEFDNGFEWKDKPSSTQGDFGVIYVSLDFGKTVGWHMQEGRDFSKDFKTDSTALVINQTAAKFTGLKNPVGETIKWDGKPYHIIGVVNDMVMQSPYEPVSRSIFTLSSNPENVISLRINPSANAHDAIAKIETVFKRYNPEQPFDYKFVDDQYAKKFGDEQRTGKIAGFFAGFAIFISCLGLFGMASFVAEQRIKEIGVRKVLGASVFNLWRLLSKDFVVLVIVSCIIAIPVAYYFLDNWLKRYQYHTNISWWILATAGVGALIITLLTVSYQSIKAALANPVKSLRTE